MTVPAVANTIDEGLDLERIGEVSQMPIHHPTRKDVPFGHVST